MILIGSKPEVLRGTNQVARNTFAVLQTEAIMKLSFGHALIGSNFEVFCGSNKISCDIRAVIKTKPLIELVLGRILIGQVWERVHYLRQVQQFAVGERMNRPIVLP
jgi:hypothetical protein